MYDRCPICGERLVLAGHIRQDPPQYWMAVYRCVGWMNHDWRRDELMIPKEPEPIAKQISMFDEDVKE